MTTLTIYAINFSSKNMKTVFHTSDFPFVDKPFHYYINNQYPSLRLLTLHRICQVYHPKQIMVNHFLHISTNSPSISPPLPSLTSDIPVTISPKLLPKYENSSTKRTSILPLPSHILPPLPRLEKCPDKRAQTSRDFPQLVRLLVQLVSNFRERESEVFHRLVKFFFIGHGLLTRAQVLRKRSIGS